jgi:hypothetical protein
MPEEKGGGPAVVDDGGDCCGGGDARAISKTKSFNAQSWTDLFILL